MHTSGSLNLMSVPFLWSRGTFRSFPMSSSSIARMASAILAVAKLQSQAHCCLCQPTSDHAKQYFGKHITAAKGCLQCGLQHRKAGSARPPSRQRYFGGLVYHTRRKASTGHRLTDCAPRCLMQLWLKGLWSVRAEKVPEKSCAISRVRQLHSFVCASRSTTFRL